MIESFFVKKSCLLLGTALLAAPLPAQNTVGELYSGDASVRGAISLSSGGMHVLSGSQVAAGDAAALLKLRRGGQLRVCPRTTLSLGEGNGGLVLGLNAGSVELDYALASGADMLLTPDFRMQLISPGSFRLALSVAPSGDTCLRTLQGDDAAVFVAEMMGSDSYQLSPGKSILFRGGKIAGATDAPANCGCPETKAAPPAPDPAPAAPAMPVAPPAAAQPHMEVNTPFVFNGNEAHEDLYTVVARLSASTDNSMLALALIPKVTPPADPAKPAEKKAGFLHQVKQFFHRLFS